MPRKQVVTKPSDLGAKDIPNNDINLYVCISQRNFLVFVETCENGEGKSMNINWDPFFYNYLKGFNINGLQEQKPFSTGRAKKELSEWN